jgi:membrane-bound lytic murein transglycosylase B
MSFGWGGAMGPAQFIPSTWIKYKDRVKQITGSADPWNVKDAFVAAALYLADYGAVNGNIESERKAAMIYFSGTTNQKYSFYANSVMSIASRYEEDIKILEKSQASQNLKLFSLNFHPLFFQYRESSF